MNKLFLSIVLCFCSLLVLSAQEYEVYNYNGKVEVSDLNVPRHVVKTAERLNESAHLFIQDGDFLTLRFLGTDDFVSLGRCDDAVLKELIKPEPLKFFKRVRSVLKGTEGDGFNAAIKGDEYTSSFVYALRNPEEVKSAFDISFQLMKDGKPVEGPLHFDDVVSFRVTNNEVFPLFVSIIWIDSTGEVMDCFSQSKTVFFLCPASSSVDFAGDKDMEMIVSPPSGVEKIYLLASEEFINTDDLLKAMDSGEVPASSDKSIGFKGMQIKIEQ